MKTRDQEVIEERVEKRDPDGTVEIRTIRIRRSSESTDEQVAEVIAALA